MSAPNETADDGSQPGVLGDETEEQNLGQPGDPAARITEADVQAAFGGDDAAAVDDEHQESAEAEEEEEDEIEDDG